MLSINLVIKAQEAQPGSFQKYPSPHSSQGQTPCPVCHSLGHGSQDGLGPPRCRACEPWLCLSSASQGRAGKGEGKGVGMRLPRPHCWKAPWGQPCWQLSRRP